MNAPKIENVRESNWVTQLDFRSKFFVAIIVSLIAFLWEDPLLGGVLTLATLVVSIYGGVRPAYLWLIIRMMIPFFLMLWATHGFLSSEHLLRISGNDSLTSIWKIPEAIWVVGGASLSMEGTLYSLNILFKSATMVIVVSLAIFTSEPHEMVVSMVRARVPYKIAFIFSSTLRFFPVLYQDIQSIIETQKLRGVPYDEMSTLKRVRVYSKLAIPLNLGALFKAQQTEVVLQARGFSASAHRIYLYDSVLRKSDILTLGGSAAAFLLCLSLYFTNGLGRF